MIDGAAVEWKAGKASQAAVSFLSGMAQDIARRHDWNSHHVSVLVIRQRTKSSFIKW